MKKFSLDPNSQHFAFVTGEKKRNKDGKQRRRGSTRNDEMRSSLRIRRRLPEEIVDPAGTGREGLLGGGGGGGGSGPRGGGLRGR